MTFKLLYFICILNASMLVAQSIHPADAWQSVLVIKDKDGTTLNLTFGKAVGATGGLDTWLGEQELPPYPPSGIFDARFLYEAPFTGYSSLTDLRSANLTQAKWTTRVQQGANGYQMLYSWNPASLPPQGTFYLQDAFDGIVFKINMRNSSSYTVTNSALNNVLIVSDGLNALTENPDNTPQEFGLLQNYPNPFNPSTVIPFSLPAASHVTITVYNVLGVKVQELLNDTRQAGKYSVPFNAAGLASGTYLCRLQANGLTSVKRMVYLK